MVVGSVVNHMMEMVWGPACGCVFDAVDPYFVIEVKIVFDGCWPLDFWPLFILTSC